MLGTHSPEGDDERGVLPACCQEDNEEEDDEEWYQVVAAVVTLPRERRVPGMDKILVDALT